MVVEINKAYFFVGPETTIDISYFQNISNNSLKVYGNGKSAVNCKDYKLPEHSRMVVFAHGANLHEFLRMSGVDPNIIKSAHMIKLCKSDRSFEISYKIFNKISASKPLNIELFSCYGGLAVNDINHLPPYSTITTYIPANSNASRHIEYFYFQGSFSSEDTNNPFIRFAYNMLYNTNELQFAINTGNETKIFASSIFSSGLFASKDAFSASNIADWQLNEFKSFKEFCSEIDTQNSVVMTEQIKNFNASAINYSDYVKAINIVQYKAALLISSIDKSNLNIAKIIIDSGVDINQKLLGSGTSALLSASNKGNAEIVKFLLEQKDINVNIQDDIGLTPLYMASQQNRTEIVDILLNNLNTDPNIDVNPESDKMGTALDIAVYLKNDAIAKRILASGGFTYEQHWKIDGSGLIKKHISLFKKDPVKYILKFNNDVEHAIHALNELIKFDDFNRFTTKISATINCLNDGELGIVEDLIKLCGDFEVKNEL